jgi:hypothetical protein
MYSQIKHLQTILVEMAMNPLIKKANSLKINSNHFFAKYLEQK